MHRNNFSLADLADLNTLADAFWRAARKKQDRVEVQRFARHLDEQLDRLARQIRNETLTLGHFNHFRIHDPKPREISAPGFRERVLHHALIHHLGPILDRAAVYDSYACRKGKGPVRAVLRAQQHLRRFSWYVQIDIRRYFDSIDHEILKGLVRRKLKDRGVLALCDRIIDSYHTTPGCGLPIGALTSQYFANLYLDGLPSNMSCRRHLFQHKHRARNLTRSLRDDTVVLLAEPTPITGG
ncbi:MAG: reverse transcriptase domain-containing protein, partial [bacterium]